MSVLRHWLVTLLLATSLAGCTAATFFAVNLPASLGHYQRTTDVDYGAAIHQQLDIYQPDINQPGASLSDGTSPGLRPVVIFIHGGSWASGSKKQYLFVGSTLAAQGYVAVLPNYRLSPAVRFPVFVEDAALAVAWTLREISRYGGDPHRVYLMGHSAGAHIAMLVALDRHYLADDGATADDLRGVIGLSGPYAFAINSRLLRKVFGSAADPGLTQPVNFVRGDAPPILLIHGTDDHVCDVRNSIELSDRLIAAGTPVELRLFDGLGHSDTVAALSPLSRHHRQVLAELRRFIAAH
ncbi:MAG: alpha/beta hydrolase [Gammaproteobacteria bacterium]